MWGRSSWIFSSTVASPTNEALTFQTWMTSSRSRTLTLTPITSSSGGRGGKGENEQTATSQSGHTRHPSLQLWVMGKKGTWSNCFPSVGDCCGKSSRHRRCKSCIIFSRGLDKQSVQAKWIFQISNFTLFNTLPKAFCQFLTLFWWDFF